LLGQLHAARQAGRFPHLRCAGDGPDAARPLTGDVVAHRGSLVISPEHRWLRHREDTNGAAFDRLAADPPLEEFEIDGRGDVSAAGVGEEFRQ
jgi:hypothetical protein